MLRGGNQRHHDHLIRLLLAVLFAASCGRPSPKSQEELYRQAVLSLQHGDLKQAQAEADRGAAAWRGAPGSIWHWNYRILSAETLIAQGRPKEALALVEAEFPTTLEIRTLEARWKTAQASALLRVGRTNEALKRLDEAQAVAERAGQRPLLPKIEGIRGQLLMSLNRSDDADKELRSALKHAEEEHDFYYQAAALNNLGFSRIRRFRYDEAIPWLERALVAAEQAGARLIASAATTNIGLCATQLGDFDKAIASNKKAIGIQEQLGAKPFLQATLGEMGNTYVLQNDPETAIPYYRRALDLAREVNATSDASKWSGNLAIALISAKQLDQAEALNKQSVALKEQVNDTASQSHSRLIAASIAAEREQYEIAREQYEEAIRSAAGDPSVQWEAHAGLGKVFRKTGDDRRASVHFETAIRIIEDATLTAPANSRYTLLARLIRFYQEYVDALVDRQAYDQALQVVESSRARVLFERLGQRKTASGTRPAPDYPRTAARSGAVLLSYWLAPKRSFLWVVTPSAKQMFILPPRQEIETLVESHQTFIRNLRSPIDAGPIAGDRLYEILLAPARRLVPRGAKVILVADGPLHNLNFETLPVPGDPRHYWIEDVTVSIAPSLNGPFDVGIGRPKSLLLIGDPESAAKEYPRLPFAGREIHNIEQRLGSWQKTVHAGSAAFPGAYRASQPQQFSIIHFAAHASANRESPLDSAIILSPDSDSFKLYARDLIDLPLSADLVTISGCRSAGARVYSGEGLVGFTWAFLQAGAKNVIAGLWDVSDASTAELMDRLYEGIAAGQAPAEALRSAKLALIHAGGNFRKPYYWGPFQHFTR